MSLEFAVALTTLTTLLAGTSNKLPAALDVASSRFGPILLGPRSQARCSSCSAFPPTSCAAASSFARSASTPPAAGAVLSARPDVEGCGAPASDLPSADAVCFCSVSVPFCPSTVAAGAASSTLRSRSAWSESACAMGPGSGSARTRTTAQPLGVIASTTRTPREALAPEVYEHA